MTSPLPIAPPLSVRALTRRYGERTVLHGLSVEVATGEIVGLLGPNGAGKTTLLETVEGIQAPTLGEVRIFGYSPRSLPAHKRAKVGFVFQRNALPDHVTVAQMLTLYSRTYGASEHLEMLVASLGLAHLLTRVVGELSVGQRQRLSVFGALAGSPSLLLMDEPTSSLDLRSRRAVWDAVQSRKREGELSGLIATHDMEEAAVLCDRVLFIEDGRLRGEMSMQATTPAHQSTLPIRFGAPADFVRDCAVLQPFALQPCADSCTYRFDCPRERVPEVVAALLTGECTHEFDAGLMIGQRSLESAYLAHVSTAE